MRRQHEAGPVQRSLVRAECVSRVVFVSVTPPVVYTRGNTLGCC